MGDASEAFTQSVANGAIPVLEPVQLRDELSGGTLVLAEVKLYGDVVLRYISGSYEVQRCRRSPSCACAVFRCFQLWPLAILT